jgi:hypothetical protein
LHTHVHSYVGTYVIVRILEDFPEFFAEKNIERFFKKQFDSSLLNHDSIRGKQIVVRTIGRVKPGANPTTVEFTATTPAL